MEIKYEITGDNITIKKENRSDTNIFLRSWLKPIDWYKKYTEER